MTSLLSRRPALVAVNEAGLTVALYYMESGKHDDNLSQPFGLDAYDPEMAEAALIYHRELAQSQAKRLCAG